MRASTFSFIFLNTLLSALGLLGCGRAPSDTEELRTDADAGGIVAEDTGSLSERDSGAGCASADEPKPEACGLNRRGTQDYVCEDNHYVLADGCADADVCRDGDTEIGRACGLNNNGESLRRCVRGQWQSTCEDPDTCRNGAIQAITGECGFDSHYLERCVDGQWDWTGECYDPDPLDDDLLAASEARTLIYQCRDEPLTTSQIIDRFSTGSALWTELTRPRDLSRSCSELTGCADHWRWLGGLSLDGHPKMGFAIGEDGVVYFYQGDDFDGHFLPITSGAFTATVDTEIDGPKRMFVKVTSNCFSVSSLVERSDTPTGEWTEFVWGDLISHDFEVPVRPTPDAVPSIADDACTAQPTTTTDIATAWFRPGNVRSSHSSYWTVNMERTVGTYTGTTLFESRGRSYVSATLLVRGSSLDIETSAGTFSLSADGTFGDTTAGGYVTASCLRLWEHRVTPHAGHLATAKETVKEVAITASR